MAHLVRVRPVLAWISPNEGDGPAVNVPLEVVLDGTTTRVPLFQDRAGTMPLPQPITAGARGYTQEFWAQVETLTTQLAWLSGGLRGGAIEYDKEAAAIAQAAVERVPDGVEKTADGKSLVFTRGGSPVLPPVEMPEGRQGLPGVNAIPADSFIAGRVGDRRSATGAALVDRGGAIFRGGTGHVFDATGQSGMVMADVSVDYQWPEDPRVLRYTPSGGLEVLPGSVTTMYSAFAREFVKTLPVTDFVVVVPSAVGATSFTPVTQVVDGASVTCSWDHTNTTVAVNLYARALAWHNQAVAAIQATGATAKSAGMLFSGFEGETPNMSKGVFINKMRAFINQWRTDIADPALPWMYGSLVPEYAAKRGQTYTADIAAGLAELAGDATISRLAQFYGPTGHAKPGDTIHYTSPGQVIRGRLAMDAYERARLNRTGALPTPPLNIRVDRDGLAAVVSFEPSRSRTTALTVEVSYDNGVSWSGATLDPDSRLFATAPCMPWQRAQFRIRTSNSAAAIVNSEYAYSSTLPPIGSIPAALVGARIFGLGNTPVAPSKSAPATIYAVYQMPASGGAVAVNARKGDSGTQLLLLADQSGAGTDLAQGKNSVATLTTSFPAPKGAPGYHVSAVAVAADGASTRAKRDSAASVVTTGTGGTHTIENLVASASGAAKLLAGVAFLDAAHDEAQMVAVQSAIAVLFGIAVP